MFDDILSEPKKEKFSLKEWMIENGDKCVGECDPDMGCDCPARDDSYVPDTDAIPYMQSFLERWKSDIEEGNEPPLTYADLLHLYDKFVEDLVDESGIAYVGWEAVDEPEKHSMFDDGGPEMDRDKLNVLCVQAARSTMSNIFKEDPDFRRSYSDNIAMTIYDQLRWGMGVEVSKEIRDKAAEAILKLIFD